MARLLYPNHSEATLHQRCIALMRRMIRRGIRPAWIEPRVERQAMLENAHNVAHQFRARAAKRHARKHDQLTEQAKAWKAEYEAARRLGERFVHAEKKPHPLLVAYRHTTL